MYKEKEDELEDFGAALDDFKFLNKKLKLMNKKELFMKLLKPDPILFYLIIN